MQESEQIAISEKVSLDSSKGKWIETPNFSGMGIKAELQVLPYETMC